MFFFFQAEDGIRDLYVTGVQTCALPICGEVEQDLLDGARVGQHRRAIWGRRDTYFDAFRQQAPQHLREIPHEPREVDRPQLELTGAAEREELADHRRAFPRSEEHTSELQSRRDLVCRLLLEKKKIKSRQAR